VQYSRRFSFKLEKSAKTKRVKQRESLKNNNEETRKSRAEETTREEKGRMQGMEKACQAA
jgi:hypothetical protein